jgi:ATP phosphoribosyltransferase
MKGTKGQMLTIALPKGRLLEEAAGLFNSIGVDISSALKDQRRLIF